MLNKTINLYKSAYQGFSREVWLLSGVLLINRSGTMVIPFLSVYLTQVLQFTLIQTGWVMSCFGAGSVLGAYLGGKLTDRIGYYQIQFWSLILSGVAFISLGYVSSLFSVCVVVFMASTLADAFRPANLAALTVYSHKSNRTRAVGLQRMAVNLGWAIGPAAGGIIAVSLGYNWLFWVDGLTCIGAGIFFRLSLDERADKAERARQKQEEEANPLLATSAWKDRAFLLFLLFVLFNGIVFMQLFSTLPVFFKEQVHLNEGEIGKLLALGGLFIAIAEMPLLFVIERRFKPWQLISAGTFFIGLSYLLFNIFGTNGGTAIACILILTLGEMLSLPFIATMAMGFAPEKTRGEYMALFTMTFSVSHIIAPMVGMQIADRFSFEWLWWFILGISIICWLGFRGVGKREAVKENVDA